MTTTFQQQQQSRDRFSLARDSHREELLKSQFVYARLPFYLMLTILIVKKKKKNKTKATTIQ
jgi:hypothetical protein